MSVLTTKARKKLSDSDYAIPEQHKYPIPDHAHAIAALQRISEFGTPAEKAEVKAAVHRKFPDVKIAGKITK